MQCQMPSVDTKVPPPDDDMKFPLDVARALAKYVLSTVIEKALEASNSL